MATQGVGVGRSGRSGHRWRYRAAATAVVIAVLTGAAWLAGFGDCGATAGGLVVHDARGQPRLSIGLTGRCQGANR